MLFGRTAASPAQAVRRRAGPLVSLVAAALGLVVLALLAAAAAMSVYVPLMTDEVSTKVAYAHVFEEHGNFVTLLPMCAGSWVQRVPLPLYPGAVLTTLLWGGVGLLGIRVIGIVLAVLAHGGIAWIACTALATRREKLWVTAALAAMSSLGVMPFVVVLSRPEQVAKVCLVAFAAMAVLARRHPRSRAAAVVLPIAFLVVASLFFFTHPKALFYLPFVLAAGAFAASTGRPRMRRVSQALVLGGVVVLAFACYRASVGSVRCDEEPVMAKFMSGLALSPQDLARAPGAFLRAGLHNVVETPMRAWKEVLFAANNTGWVPLPRKPLPQEMRDLNEQSAIAFVALFGIVPLLCVAALRRRGARVRAHLLLGGTLLASLGANAFFYNVLPYYNCTLLLPALSLAAALAISADARPVVPRPLAMLAVCALLVLAGRNLVALLGHFGPPLVASRARIGPVVPDQPLAVPVFGYDAEVPKIRALASACGIAGDGARHLVIDDYTAFAFEHLRESINMLYVTDVIPLFGKPLEGEKIRPFLRRLDSPGVIGRCWLLPKALRPVAKRSDDYCCVGASGLGDEAP